MASARATLKVSTRSDFGSRSARRLRRDGKVPGVVYTGGAAARPFTADAHEIDLFLGEGQTLFDLELDGGSAVPVVVKEEQRHPVRGDLVHIDCHEVDLKTEIQAEVEILLEGTDDAPGVKDGGILEHVTREITVEALPEAVPDSISVDVSSMEIGDTLQLSTISPPPGVTLMADHPDEMTLATLNPPRIEEEPEPDVEEETELIGEEGAEGEEGEADEAAEDDGGDGDGDEG
ncbi:MAG TPA: 50S ribosomal protein L25 [Solirubrobacterales bacterium]|nr:50S ribosomal protein L25 [Solirubrobacterales bacterium]